MTAERSANDVWLQDSNVFCACARRFIACSSVRSSNVATIWLSYGLTVWYAMVIPPSVPADRPPIWTSSFLHEISVFTTDYAQLLALTRFCVSACAFGAALSLRPSPNRYTGQPVVRTIGRSVTNRQDCTALQYFSPPR